MVAMLVGASVESGRGRELCALSKMLVLALSARPIRVRRDRGFRIAASSFSSEATTSPPQHISSDTSTPSPAVQPSHTFAPRRQPRRIAYHVGVDVGRRPGRRSFLRTPPPLFDAATHESAIRREKMLTNISQGRAALVALRRSGGGAGPLGRSFYKGGFEPKMTRREAALILEMPYVARAPSLSSVTCHARTRQLTDLSAANEASRKNSYARSTDHSCC